MPKSKLKILMVACQKDAGAKLEGNFTGYIWHNFMIQIHNNSRAYKPWTKIGIYETVMRKQQEKQKQERGEAKREEGRREGGCEAGMVGS